MLQGYVPEPGGQAWDVQTVFVANDWPTAILPLHLLAIQSPAPYLRKDFSQLLREHTGDTHVATHSRSPVSACKHLGHFPDVSPADKAWHEAFDALHGAMQESLQSSKVPHPFPHYKMPNRFSAAPHDLKLHVSV